VLSCVVGCVVRDATFGKVYTKVVSEIAVRKYAFDYIFIECRVFTAPSTLMKSEFRSVAEVQEAGRKSQVASEL
jgi:hypothetical protein